MSIRLSAVKQSSQPPALDDPSHSVLVSNPVTSRCRGERRKKLKKRKKRL